MGDFRQIPPVGSVSLMHDALYPKADGFTRLFRMFLTLVFDEQKRAQDPEQEAFIKRMKAGRADMDLMKSVGVLTRSDVRDGFVDGALFIAAFNAERHQLNSVLAERFAKKHGHPIIKWKHPLRGAGTHHSQCGQALRQ